MGQITWHNIAIPDFNSSERKNQTAAGSPLNPAFTAFNKMFEDHDALYNQNRENVIANNDKVLQDQAAQIADLKGYNSMKAAGQLDPSAIRGAAGNMFNETAFTENLNKRKEVLQTNVADAARPIADSIGSKRLSTEEGTVAYVQELIQNGVAPNEANRMGLEYQNTNAVNENLYKKSRSENTRGLLEKFGIPETREQIINFMDEADKTGIIYDRGAFENQLSKEFEWNRADKNQVNMDEDRANQKILTGLNIQNAQNIARDREIERANVTKLNALAPGVVKTGNFKALLDSGLPMDKIMQAIPAIASIRFAASQPLPEEQKLFDQANKQMLADADVILSDKQTVIDAKTKKYTEGMGYSPQLINTAAEGIVSKEGIGRFLGGEDFGGKIQTAFNNLIHQEGLPEDQAGAIIVRAWQATAGENKSLWFDNFADGKFKKQITKSKAQYKTYAPLLDEIAAAKKDLEQTSLALTTDIANRTSATFSALERSKLSDENITMQDILNGVTTATADLKEGSPLGVAEGFKRDAIRRQEQAAREAGTPEDQARTAARLKEVQDSLTKKAEEASEKKRAATAGIKLGTSAYDPFGPLSNITEGSGAILDDILKANQRPNRFQ